MTKAGDPFGAPDGFTRRSLLAASVVFPLALRSTAWAGPGAAAKASTFVQHGPRTAKMFALTFHGAGDPNLTRQMLILTRRVKAPITVFAVGTWVSGNSALVRDLASAGHELANHTLNHPALRRLDRVRVAAEIAGCATALRSATGSPGAWFRPSGTPTPTPLMLEEAAKAGYPTVIGYDVDPRDYQDPGSQLVVSRTVAGLQAGSIVSLHLGHAGTVESFEAIVAAGRAQGWQPVTVSTLLNA